VRVLDISDEDSRPRESGERKEYIEVSSSEREEEGRREASERRGGGGLTTRRCSLQRRGRGSRDQIRLEREEL